MKKGFVSLIWSLLFLFLMTHSAWAKVNLNTTDASTEKVEAIKQIVLPSVVHSSESDYKEVEELDENSTIKAGLLLSGGYEECVIHIGVLRSIEQYKIPIDYVYGSSWGALIAALWAVDYSADEIENIFKLHAIPEIMRNEKEVGYERFVSPNGVPGIELNYTFHTGSDTSSILAPFIATNKNIETIASVIAEYIAPRVYQRGGHFDSLKIPLRIIASDQKKRAPVILDSANISTALLATIINASENALFQHDTNSLFDGTIYARFPVDAVLERREANWVIAVDAEPVKHKPVQWFQDKQEYFRKLSASYPIEEHYYSENMLILQASKFRTSPDQREYIQTGANLVKRKLDAIIRVFGGTMKHKTFMQQDSWNEQFTFGQLHLNTLAPEFHRYIGYLIKYYPLEITPKDLSSIVKDIYASPYFYKPQLSLSSQLDSTMMDVEIETQVQDKLQIKGGLFSAYNIYPHVFGKLSYSAINQFEYQFSVQGWVGNYAQGIRLDALFNALGGARFFFKISQLYNRIALTELEGELKNRSPIQKENHDSLLVEVGYRTSHDGYLFADMRLDNSSYLVEYSNLQKGTHLKTVIKSFSFGFGGSYSTLDDGIFSGTGSQIYIHSGLNAEGFPDSTIQYQAPLHWRTTGSLSYHRSAFEMFHAGMQLNGGVDLDYKQFGKAPQSFKSSLEGFENHDHIMAQRYKIPMNLTVLSRIGYTPENYSYAFSQGALSFGIVKEAMGGWLRLHSIHSFDNGGEYLDGHTQEAIVESILRYSFKSIEILLVLEKELTTNSDFRFGVIIGNFPF